MYFLLHGALECRLHFVEKKDITASQLMGFHEKLLSAIIGSINVNIGVGIGVWPRPKECG